MGGERRTRPTRRQHRRPAPTPRGDAKAPPSPTSPDLLGAAGNRATGHVLRDAGTGATPATPELLQRRQAVPAPAGTQQPVQRDLGASLAAGLVTMFLAWLSGESLGRGAVRGLVTMGVTDEKNLTNLVFWARHPEAAQRAIEAHERDLVKSWKQIRRDLVRPVLKSAKAGGGTKGGSKGGSKAKGTKAMADRATLTNAERTLLKDKPDYGPEKATAQADVEKIIGSLTDSKRNTLLTKNNKGKLTIDSVRRVTKQTLTTGEVAELSAALDALWDVREKVAELNLATVKAAMMRDILAARPQKGETDPIAAAEAAVAEWFGEVETGATFLGVRIRDGIHRELRERMDVAADAIKARLGTSDDAEAARQMGVTQIFGMRKPKAATGGSSPSLHCYGLAVDINHHGNPFVRGGRTDASTRRAMLLVHQEDVEETSVLKPAAADAGAQWDRLNRQSEALRSYLNLDDEANATLLATLSGALRDAGLDARSDDQWRTQIAADRNKLQSSNDFSGHARAHEGGFMDLEKTLVEELAAADLFWGGMYKKGKDLMHFDYRRGSLERLST